MRPNYRMSTIMERDQEGTGGWVSLKSAAQSQRESEMMVRREER